MVNLKEVALNTWSVWLRYTLFILAIIALGTTGRLNSIGYDISRVNLGIAASVLTLFFTVGLGIYAEFRPFRDSQWVLLGVDAFDFVLLLAAAASITDIEEVCHAYSYSFYIKSSNDCGVWRAAEAFLFLAWIATIPLLYIDLAKADVFSYFKKGKTPAIDPEAHIDTVVDDKIPATEEVPRPVSEDTEPNTAEAPAAPVSDTNRPPE